MASSAANIEFGPVVVSIKVLPGGSYVDVGYVDNAKIKITKEKQQIRNQYNMKPILEFNKNWKSTFTGELQEFTLANLASAFGITDETSPVEILSTFATETFFAVQVVQTKRGGGTITWELPYCKAVGEPEIEFKMVDGETRIPITMECEGDSSDKVLTITTSA